jgi:hypothetical protein
MGTTASVNENQIATSKKIHKLQTPVKIKLQQK